MNLRRVLSEFMEGRVPVQHSKLLYNQPVHGLQYLDDHIPAGTRVVIKWHSSVKGQRSGPFARSIEPREITSTLDDLFDKPLHDRKMFHTIFRSLFSRGERHYIDVTGEGDVSWSGDKRVNTRIRKTDATVEYSIPARSS